MSRWTEITPVAAHADELFEWTGEECHRWFETRELTDEEVVELEREREERVAALGIRPLTVSLPVELHPYGEDELCTIGLSARMDGLLERRPRSDEPWDEVSQHVHVERWSDDTWDWLIGTDEHPEVLAEIRRQLVEPRLDEG